MTVADVPAAVAAADRSGYPVAVKLAGGRPDLGEVRLDLADADDVARAAADLLGRGEVVVQPMAPPGVSCRIEAVEDPSFGPVVGFGPGGIAGGLLGDRAWRAGPPSHPDTPPLIPGPEPSPLLFEEPGAPPAHTAPRCPSLSCGRRSIGAL